MLSSRTRAALAAAGLTVLNGAVLAQSNTLAVHPENSRYFIYNNKPTVLVTSGEHYGAVVNKAFNYETYLNTLAADGLNNTRIFSGSYIEIPNAFGTIENNTLAPHLPKDNFIAPWARSSTPKDTDYYGNKFDLTQWDPAYFARLKDFVQKASDRGIIVEMTFFSAWYRDEHRALMPMNPVNHINSLAALGGEREVEKALVRKIVTELNGFDNVYYEIANENYGGPNNQNNINWEHGLAKTVADTEATLPKKHLVSMNIANGEKGSPLSAHAKDWWKMAANDPRLSQYVSIYNFHYAHPEVASQNQHINKIIGDNETGFNGRADQPYRSQAWQFLLSGGALYNNLDFSFTVGKEDGTFNYLDKTPGGGSVALRKQLGVVKNFIHSVDFVKMAPVGSSIFKTQANAEIQTMAETGKQYAAYLDLTKVNSNQGNPSINLPAGTYAAQWVDALTGNVIHSRTLHALGGYRPLQHTGASKEYGVRLIKTSNLSATSVDGFGGNNAAGYKFVPISGNATSLFGVSGGQFNATTDSAARQGFLHTKAGKLTNVGDAVYIDIDFGNGKTTADANASGGLLFGSSLGGNAQHRLLTVRGLLNGEYQFLIDGANQGGSGALQNAYQGILTLMVTKTGYNQMTDVSSYMAEIMGGNPDGNLNALARGSYVFEFTGNEAYFGPGLILGSEQSVWLDNLTLVAVPEPCSLGIGVGAVMLLARRQRA